MTYGHVIRTLLKVLHSTKIALNFNNYLLIFPTLTFSFNSVLVLVINCLGGRFGINSPIAFFENCLKQTADSYKTAGSYKITKLIVLCRLQSIMLLTH